MIPDRAQIHLVDIIMSLFLVIAIVLLAPYFYEFTDMIASEADGFSSILLQLVLPFLIISLIVSIGVSAKRRSP